MLYLFKCINCIVFRVSSKFEKHNSIYNKIITLNILLYLSINEWDHRFHGVNDKEAELMDPQQRIVLDCVHMALEDGGITSKDIDGTQTGVFIGEILRHT